MTFARALLCLVALAQLASAHSSSDTLLLRSTSPRSLLDVCTGCLPGRPPAYGCPCTSGCLCAPPPPDERYRRGNIAAAIVIPILMVLFFTCIVVYVLQQRRQRREMYASGAMMYGAPPYWAQHQGGMQMSPMVGGYPASPLGPGQSFGAPPQAGPGTGSGLGAPRQDDSRLHGLQNNIQTLEMQNATLRAEAAESRRVAEAAAAAAAAAQASVDELARQRMRKGSVMEDLAAIQASQRPPR